MCLEWRTLSAPAAQLAFRDQVCGIAAQSVGEQQDGIVGDALGAFLDGLNLVGSQCAFQSTRDEAGLFDGADQLARGPAMVVAPTANGKTVEKDHSAHFRIGPRALESGRAPPLFPGGGGGGVRGGSIGLLSPASGP